MTITELCCHKGETWKLVLDDERTVFLNIAAVEDFRLEKGGEISEEELEELVNADTLRKAKRRALYLLGVRQYCEAELLSKLRQSYDEETALAALQYIIDSGYINDEDYAGKLAEQLIRGKHWGLAKVRYEMLHRGLDANLVEDVLAEYSDDDIDEEITELLTRKYRQKLSDPDDRRRTVAALARRGYGFSAIKRCIAALIDEDEDDFE